MRHDPGQVLRVDGVQDIEEVLAAWASLSSILVLEVDVEGGIFFEVLPQVLDRQLIPVRHMDELDILLLEQLLLIGKDLPEEVLVDL